MFNQVELRPSPKMMRDAAILAGAEDTNRCLAGLGARSGQAGINSPWNLSMWS